MKVSEFRNLSKDELLLRLKELREALFNLKFQHATGRLENTAAIVRTRKDIARAMTVLGETDRAKAA